MHIFLNGVSVKTTATPLYLLLQVSLHGLLKVFIQTLCVFLCNVHQNSCSASGQVAILHQSGVLESGHSYMVVLFWTVRQSTYMND